MLSQAAVSCLWKAYLTHSLPTVCTIRCLPESAMVCLVRDAGATSDGRDKVFFDKERRGNPDVVDKLFYSWN